MLLLLYVPIVVVLVICVFLARYLVKRMSELENEVQQKDRENNEKLEKFLCETRDSFQRYSVLSDLLLELYKVPVWSNMFPELCNLEIEIRMLLEDHDNVTPEDIFRIHNSFEILYARMKYYVMFVQMHKLMQHMDIVTSVLIEEDLSVHFSKPHGVYRYQVSAGKCVPILEKTDK